MKPSQTLGKVKSVSEVDKEKGFENQRKRFSSRREKCGQIQNNPGRHVDQAVRDGKW